MNKLTDHDFYKSYTFPQGKTFQRTRAMENIWDLVDIREVNPELFHKTDAISDISEINSLPSSGQESLNENFGVDIKKIKSENFDISKKV